jgi:hypothetical protein
MKLLDIGHRLVAGGLMVATVGGFGALYSGYASWSAHMRKLKAALAESAAAAEPAAASAAAAVATAAATNEKVA